MTITPNYWGAGLWKIMYSIAFEYPNEPQPEQKKVVKDFFESLRTLLPCDDCRKHYDELLKAHPVGLHLTNGDSLKKYVNLLQTKVNQKEGKPAVTLASVTAEISRFIVKTPPPKPAPVAQARVPAPAQARAPKQNPRAGRTGSGFAVKKSVGGAVPRKKRGCGCGR